MGFETGTARLAWGATLVLTFAVALCLVPFSFVDESWDQEQIAHYVMPAEETWPDWFRRLTKNLTGEALTEAEFVASATGSTTSIRLLLVEEASGEVSPDEHQKLEQLRARRLFPALDEVFTPAHFAWGFFLGWVFAIAIGSALLFQLTAGVSIWIWRGYRG